MVYWLRPDFKCNLRQKKGRERLGERERERVIGRERGENKRELGKKKREKETK